MPQKLQNNLPEFLLMVFCCIRILHSRHFPQEKFPVKPSAFESEMHPSHKPTFCTWRISNLLPIFDNYREISRAAVEKIKENDTVYLTGGSFGHIMVSFLPKDIHYTVVVNSVDIGKELRSFDNIDVYIVGGKMRQSGSLVDSLANEFVSRLHFDLCFITGAGLTAEVGLSNGTDETAAFQRTVIKNSRNRYLVIPSSKIGMDSFIKVCDVDSFDAIITDWDCAEDQIASIEEKGIEITIVEEPK